ncbi:unnamed protein product [Spirodela intermedia]|uniref:Uncharacterized protein n=1 Tax=Spirodela intermedia TaxID=51605 RepID=A0A811GE16_SPIIN|nr:unnamed protein product [Spirodela intermedia]
MHTPTFIDWINLKHLLRCLKGSIMHGLQFYKNSEKSVSADSDVDWAGSRDDQRSTRGYLIFIGNNLIYSSKKQPTIARSSTKDEYKALANTTAEITWIQSLLTENNIQLSSPTTIHCNNIGVTYLATNLVFHSHMKHVEMIFTLYVRK